MLLTWYMGSCRPSTKVSTTYSKVIYYYSLLVPGKGPDSAKPSAPACIVGFPARRARSPGQNYGPEFELSRIVM